MLKDSCGAARKGRPRALRRKGAAFPALWGLSGAGDGTIWVVPRIFPSHVGGEVYFFWILQTKWMFQ
jgi:hypothetical protein